MKKYKNHQIHPQEVADKSIAGNLRKSIHMALEVESAAVRHNTQSFNKNRYTAINNIDDYQQLKDQARTIKENSIESLPQLLKTLEQAVKNNGGYFYLADDAASAREYIAKICVQHEAKLAIKAKTITSEEIKLNDALETAGIEVAETDLAEFILQISKEQPSHIVAPAIHRSRERISELFKNHFNTNLALDSGEELTKFARDILRKKFLSADVGISGANMIAADCGTMLLVESEGNIRMAAQAPPLHIALAGIEKIVPTREDLIPFLELLAPSATGQPLTSYTQLIKPPLKIPSFSFDGKAKKKREFHLVLVNNGRMQMREDTVLREALYCIRCSACMNSCANFQVVGGHAYGGETYSGGIGGSWEAGTGVLEKANFNALCSGCSRCVPNCPVKIDIPWLNENLRHRLNEKKGKGIGKLFFANYAAAAKWGSAFAPLSNKTAGSQLVKNITEKMIGVDKRRSLPEFKKNTLSKAFKKSRVKAIKQPFVKTLLFADVYTNHLRPKAGMAVVKILRALNVDVQLSKVFAEGRAALSQGMLDTAKKRAMKTAAYILPFIEKNTKIVIVEPSVLALFHKDYAHFINEVHFQRLANNSFDAMAFILQTIQQQKINIADIFDLDAIKSFPPVFFHSHCQQRSLGAEKATLELLKNLGFNVITSSVECCGMAGSFGYKKDFYDVSLRVGEDLKRQIDEAQKTHKDMVILANGASCDDQIHSFKGKEIFHPAELLERFLKKSI
jgi:iron-sulfur cluster protein